METMEGQNQPKIVLNREELQEFVNEEEDGRISALPDCLILEILSRLPSTKDAIRTGTLSKRWKHLWTLVHTLIFTHSLYPPSENPKSGSDFVLFVYTTLTQCRQLKLKKFEVFTAYDIRFVSHFNTWIRYAMLCKVEDLNLTFECREVPEFLFDQLFFNSSCFTDLRLKGCLLNPIGAISWKNLRTLRIFNGKLDEELIQKILLGSPVLETLELNCYGYSRLDITSKSIKNLVVTGYSDLEDNELLLDEVVEINAPNILSLTIQSDLVLWKVLLQNVSSLVEANLNYEKLGHRETTRKEAEEEMLKGFILSLRHVKELKIGVLCSNALSRLEAKGFVFPSNLKFPDVPCDWSDSDDSDFEW